MKRACTASGASVQTVTVWPAVPASMPPHAVGLHPVPATGPYMIAQVTKAKIKLVRNPRFRLWSVDAKPDGYPDVITLRELNDPSQLQSADRAVAAMTADRPSARQSPPRQ